MATSPHPNRKRPSSRGHHHREDHRIARLDWLRASVMGANDGVLSIGALLVGVAGAHADRSAVVVAGVAGLIAGAASMSVGEFVSVSAERDVFVAEHKLEARELVDDPEGETDELRAIWQRRGLPRELAADVADHLMAHDALGAHMRDELGYTDMRRPRPVMAAVSSFVSFCVGALLPLLAAVACSNAVRGPVTALATIVGLVGLGALAAWAGGASVTRGLIRVTMGGVAALGISYLIGRAVGIVL